MILTTLLACACHKQPEAAPAPARAPAPSPESVDEVTAVHRALSSRDAGPSCAEVEALTSDPVATLTTIVQTVELPPQAPMRAATCLVDRHAEAASELLVGWMGAEETRGLVSESLIARTDPRSQTGNAVLVSALFKDGSRSTPSSPNPAGSGRRGLFASTRRRRDSRAFPRSAICARAATHME